MAKNLFDKINNAQKKFCKMKKKGQLKIQEMAFVLLAVVFLAALLLLFLARFQIGKIQKAATELRELRTVTMLRMIASMPELVCSRSAICIDEDKLNAFNKSKQLQKDYSELWQSANIVNITIEEIYPRTAKKYVVYGKATRENIVSYSTFVPLCSESKYVSCKIAKIKVTVVVP